MLRHLLLVISLVVGLTSCTKYAANQEAPISTKADARGPGQAIAYEEYIAVSVASERIGEIHSALLQSCEQAAAAEQCVVLEAELFSDNATASLKLRATTAGVARIIGELSAKVALTMRQLRSQDLQAPIGDAAKRLQLLTDYRARLETLAGNLGRTRGADLDSLIRLNHELAEVQTQIETANGELARLQERVATRTVTIQLQSTGPSRVWAPLGDAFAGFGSHLAETTGALVTFCAYALPWSILLAGGVCSLLRWQVRRRRRAAAAASVAQ